MSDQYLIKHNNSLPENQLNDILTNLNNEFQQNRFFHYYSIIKSIIGNVKTYLLGLGRPSFKKRKAYKLPLSKDFNLNNIEIYNDIKNAYLEINQLKEILKTDFNYSTLFNETLKNKLKTLQNEVNDIELYIKTPHEAVITAKDSFNNLNYVDKDQTTASVITTQGTITLERTGSENHNNTEAKIEILNDSNGFPGNTHQVKILNPGEEGYNSTDNNKNIVYYGENNPHIHLVAIQDEEPDTWFEYELCNIPEHYKKDPCKGFGFEYEEGIVWAKDPEEGFLKLHLRITLPEAVTVNWINLNPYIPPFDGAEHMVIESIKTAPDETSIPTSIYKHDKINLSLISDLNRNNADTYNADQIPGQNDFTGQAVFTFAPRLVKVIDVVIRQDSKYDCEIGHDYYLAIVKVKITETSWFGLSKKTKYETHKWRVDGPKQSLDKLNEYSRGSIEEMIIGAIGGGIGGFQLGAQIGSAFGPIGAIIGGLLGGLLGSLWGGTDVDVVDKRIEAGIESFPGWRWALGIRDLNINSYQFAQESELVSTPFISPGPIEKVELRVNEQIPEEFLSGNSDQTTYENKDNWLQYYISLDDGNTWHRIAPQNSQIDNIPKTYYVNANIPPEMHKEDVEYIEAENDAYEIRFKVKLKRPTDISDADSYSPVLRDYELLLTTTIEGDNEWA